MAHTMPIPIGFQELPHHRFLLKLRRPRAGSFGAAALRAESRIVFLGLVISKVPRSDA